MSSDWNDDKEDQAKDKDKDNNQNQSQTNSSLFTVVTVTWKPPKPFINKYFDSMSSETPIVFTPKEKHRHDTITVQQELNTTECDDSLEELD